MRRLLLAVLIAGCAVAAAQAPPAGPVRVCDYTLYDSVQTIPAGVDPEGSPEFVASLTHPPSNDEPVTGVRLSRIIYVPGGPSLHGVPPLGPQGPAAAGSVQHESDGRWAVGVKNMVNFAFDNVRVIVVESRPCE